MKHLAILLLASATLAALGLVRPGHSEVNCAKDATCKNHMGCHIDTMIASKKGLASMFRKSLRDTAKASARQQKIKELEKSSSRTPEEQSMLDNLRSGKVTPAQAKEISHAATKILADAIAKMAGEGDIIYDRPACARAGQPKFETSDPPSLVTSRRYNCAIFEGDENGDPVFTGGQAQTPKDSRKKNVCSEFIDAAVKHEENHQAACKKAVNNPSAPDREDIDNWANEEAESYRIEIAELEKAKRQEGDKPRGCTPKLTEHAEQAAKDAKDAIKALKGRKP